MKDYTIKELLQRKDKRDTKLHNAINAVGFLYLAFFLGIIAIIISIATS